MITNKVAINKTIAEKILLAKSSSHIMDVCRRLDPGFLSMETSCGLPRNNMVMAIYLFTDGSAIIELENGNSVFQSKTHQEAGAILTSVDNAMKYQMESPLRQKMAEFRPAKAHLQGFKGLRTYHNKIMKKIIDQVLNQK